MSGDGRHEEQRDPRGEPGAGHDGGGGREGREPEAGGPAGPRDTPADPGAPAGPDAPADPAGLDERSLRLMLHGAVEDVAPAPDALERLHHAVPARRARRRQLTVGAAAAALVIGVATPALVQSGVITRVLDGDTTNAASAQDRQEGAGTDGRSGDAANQDADQYSAGGGRQDTAGSREGSGRGGTASSPETDDTLGPTSPSCLRSQIGDGGSTVSPADAAGHVYGAFKIKNISDASCLVDGSDTVTATPVGAADPTGFSVVAHTSGGRAAKLPDPQLEPGSFVLEPGKSYTVRFAWVPSEGGGTTGCPVSPGPDQTAPGDSSGGTDSGGGSGGDGGGGTGGGGTSGGTDSSGGSGTSGGTAPPDGGQGGEGGDTVDEPTESSGSGVSPQLAYDTGGSGSGPGATAASVVLRYVPAAGEPRIGKIEIAGACAGTVYRTGPVPVG
ncbi:hypothetical protein [Streptomyces pini]|uniref:DUF4232 domain-containing protein n=1 Tax=Streptomyces pini TaxID=1520580 RepID=A0A1I4IVF5_9ACTN|nr:hypothetical protein [Streptomyces pini]SFL57756.1 hypothetical protein SAMN05192584_1223 [Streptomyces pini]